MQFEEKSSQPCYALIPAVLVSYSNTKIVKKK